MRPRQGKRLGERTSAGGDKTRGLAQRMAARDEWETDALDRSALMLLGPTLQSSV